MKSSLNFLLIIVLIAFVACNTQHTDRKSDDCKIEIKTYFKDSITPRITYEYLTADSNTVLVSHFYKNGKLQMKGNIVGGVRDGEWVAWDNQGRMLSTGHYKDGLENGMWTVWFPGGQKRYEGLFKEGKRSGIWKFYNEQGTLLKEIEY